MTVSIKEARRLRSVTSPVSPLNTFVTCPLWDSIIQVRACRFFIALDLH